MMLHILILEDRPDDCELMIHELRRAGYELDWHCIDGQADYLQHLNESVDLILADYSLPQFNAMRALQLLQERDLDIPFIVVTGTASEQVAVECIKQGASDYVLKDRLARLVPAVSNALTEKQLAREKRQAEQALRESEIRYRSLFDATFEAIILYENGVIVDVNQAFETMFDYSPGEAAGLPLSALCFNESGDANQASMLTDMAQYEARCLQKDGMIFDAEIRTKRLANFQDHPAEVMAIRDVSERKRIEADRERMIAELDSYAHTVAHDLKGPLSGIMGYASLLNDIESVQEDEELSDLVGRVLGSSHQMLNIINELLVLASVRRQEEIPVDRLDMNLLVEGALARLDLMIAESNAELVIPAEWPQSVAYGPWIKEIWTNYISNAIKYGGTPPHIELGADIPNEGMVRFWVKDNGNGLSHEDQSRLFQPFERLERSRAKGHGLGLSIVQRIVDRLGGEVGVESEIGVGSHFYFTLPSAPPIGETNHSVDSS